MFSLFCAVFLNIDVVYIFCQDGTACSFGLYKLQSTRGRFARHGVLSQNTVLHFGHDDFNNHPTYGRNFLADEPLFVVGFRSIGVISLVDPVFSLY